MTVTLYAQPYDYSASGFYFESYEDFGDKARAARNDAGEPVEEFEIQFIDGDITTAQLFTAWGVMQSDIKAYYRALDCWDEHQVTAAIIALREGLSEFNPATDDPADLDICVYYVDNLQELAEQFVDEGLFGDIHERLQIYIDYSAIARDLFYDYTMLSIGKDRIAYRAH